MKTIKMKTVLSLCLMAMTAMPLHAVDYNIPDIGTNSRVGASMPYTRYESTDAVLGGGATLKTSTDYDSRNIATQASERSYIALPNSGSYMEWKAIRSGRGVTMRFTIPDTKSGTLLFKVNGNTVKEIEVTTKWMYQWFNYQTSGDKNDNANAQEDPISGGIPCFAFDEVHFLLDTEITAGDIIRIESTGVNGIEYGVDFIEIEKVVAPTPQPAGSISVADYGGNLQEAFNNAHGRTLYIPEGTYYSGEKLSLPNNATVVGAGIWYTNIIFTSSARGGGGFNGYNSNLDFSGVYINSGLYSRYGQDAQYKCFAGVYNNVTIHDIWEEHFECGFWVADYNLNPQGSDNLRIINCRLRNNLADGVNFCQGTCNSTVYNCSVRNNGDDGLAMWNNNHNGIRDESGNTFCYNTIDLDWRASGLAIFGGYNQKAYNNYICDGALSAGIRLNTEYGGHKFHDNSNVVLANNVIINCGTQKDIFGNPLASVILEGEVKGVTFNNTQIYDSQWDETKIDGGINVNVQNNASGSAPGYPEVDDEEVASGGPLENITGYNLKLEGIAWKNQDDNTELKQGDKVTFTAKISNNTSVDIPEGVVIGLNIVIDNNTNLTNTSYRGGLKAGEDVRLKCYWTATAGGHTIVAKVNKFPDETDENDNTREKKFNVTADPDSYNKNFTAVTGGCDLYVTDVTYKNLTRDDGTIREGDKLQFTAVAVNAGDRSTPSDIKHGVQFRVDDKGWTDAPITWCDNDSASHASHEFKEMAANGGGSQSDDRKDLYYWVATEGTHTVTAWIDDGDLIEEVDEYNNTRTITLPTIPYYGIKYIENPDQPDNLDGVAEPEPTSVKIKIGSTGYATYCHTKDLDFTGIDGLKAYIASGVKTQEGNDVVTLLIVEVNKVPAYTGILLKGTPNTEFEIPFCSTTDLYSNLLVGVTTDTYINAEANGKKNFLLANGANGVGFYPAKAGTLGANKAYLPLPSSMVQQANAIIFNPDETTDIDGVTTGKDIDENGVFYTLTGIRVTHPQKGIYIHNGKKIVVR